VDNQVSRSEHFFATEQKRTEQFPNFLEPSLTEQIVEPLKVVEPKPVKLRWATRKYLACRRQNETRIN
jgi:hypothetical protein